MYYLNLFALKHFALPLENEDAEWTHEKVELLLQSGDTKIVLNTLLSIAFYDNDWQWVQDTCLRLIDGHKDQQVIELAITCIGHTARVNGMIDKEIVSAKFDSLKHDPQLAGRIEDAWGDIMTFVK